MTIRESKGKELSGAMVSLPIGTYRLKIGNNAEPNILFVYKDNNICLSRMYIGRDGSPICVSDGVTFKDCVPVVIDQIEYKVIGQ